MYDTNIRCKMNYQLHFQQIISKNWGRWTELACRVDLTANSYQMWHHMIYKSTLYHSELDNCHFNIWFCKQILIFLKMFRRTRLFVPFHAGKWWFCNNMYEDEQYRWRHKYETITLQFSTLNHVEPNFKKILWEEHSSSLKTQRSERQRRNNNANAKYFFPLSLPTLAVDPPVHCACAAHCLDENRREVRNMKNKDNLFLCLSLSHFSSYYASYGFDYVVLLYSFLLLFTFTELKIENEKLKWNSMRIDRTFF